MPTPTDETTEAIAIAPAVALRRIARRFWPYAQPLRWWIALGLVLVVAVPAVETAKIWLFKLLIDDVLVPKDFGPFTWIAIAFVGLTLAGAAFAAADDTVSTWVGERFILRIRTDVFSHLHHLSPAQLGRRKPGDLLARLNGDISTIEGFVVGGLTDLVAYGAQAAFFIAALFLLSWDLALVALVVVPLFWFAASRFSDLIRDASRERRRRSGTISALAEESLANARLVQVYGREADQVERYRSEGEANLRAAMRATRLQALFTPAVDVIEVLGAMIVIGVGTWKLANDKISLGALLVFLTYLSQLYDPIRGLTKLATSLHSAAAGAERVIELVDEAPAVPNTVGGLRPAFVSGELRVEGVGYAYDDGTRALTDVNHTFEPGRLTVITGPNGSGKSTLAQLLMRLTDPTEGRITLDETDLTTLDRDWLRDQMAVVLQDGGVLDATIAENVAFGRLDATADEIAAALTAAGLGAFVAGLPEGTATRVGPRGARLSGGQRQRLAIARAIVRDAPIVVMDEPTNHLDRGSDAGMVDAIRALAEGRTAVVISHDPAIVAAAHTVLALRDGRLVERTRRAVARTGMAVAG